MHNKSIAFNKQTLPDYAMWFSGKTVLITGATSGIGLEITKLLTCFDVSVIPCGKDAKAMDFLLDELKAISGLRIEGFLVDFSNSESVARFITKVKEKYEVDILINNAGLGYISDFYEMPLETIQSMQEVNITAVVKLCRAFLPEMMKRSGTGILNVGSVASFFATPGSALYGATKRFILGFTDALHHEMLSKRVHVTGVYPGHTYSRFLERSTGGRMKDWEKAMHPAVVAEMALKGLRMNKRRVIPGFNNKIKVLVASFMPASMLLNRVYKNAFRHYPKG